MPERDVFSIGPASVTAQADMLTSRYTCPEVPAVRGRRER